MPRVSQSSSGKRFHCPLFIGGKKCEASYPIRGNLNRHLRNRHGCRTSKRRVVHPSTSRMKMASPLDDVPEATGPSRSTTDPSPATAYSDSPLSTFDGLFSTFDDSSARNCPSAPSFGVDARASPYPLRLSTADGYAHCPVPVAPGATSYHQVGLTPPHNSTPTLSTLASTTPTNFPTPPLSYGARSAWPSAGASVSTREELPLPSGFSWMIDDRFDLATSNSANVMNKISALSGSDAHSSAASRHLTELSAVTVSNRHPMAHPSNLARAPPDYTHSLRSEALWLARIKEAYHEEQDADELPQQLQIDPAQGWTLGPQEQMSHEQCLEQTLGMTGAWQGQETSSWSQQLDDAQEQYAPMEQLPETFAANPVPVDFLAAQQAAYSPVWSDLFLNESLLYQVYSREGPPTVFDFEEALAFDAQQDSYGSLEHMLEIAAASDHGRVYDTMI